MANTLTEERATGVNFSMKPSAIDKLNKIACKTGKSRSALLTEWLEREFDLEFPQPISLEEELGRR